MYTFSWKRRGFNRTRTTQIEAPNDTAAVLAANRHIFGLYYGKVKEWLEGTPKLHRPDGHPVDFTLQDPYKF